MRTLTLDPDHRIFENYLRNTYGLEALPLEQEMALAPNVKRTRRNKIDIIDTCASIRSTIAAIEFRARRAPAEDNQKHADLVEEYRDAVKEIYKAAEKAWSIGQQERGKRI